MSPIASGERRAGLGAPFERDRSWRIQRPLDPEAMQTAGTHMEGTHDVSTFQAKGCQRSSPIVTLSQVLLVTQPYGPCLFDNWNGNAAPSMQKHAGLLHLVHTPCDDVLLTTMLVRANAFVCRQVCNMVGCLVAVGLGHVNAHAIPELLACRNRRASPWLVPRPCTPR